MPQFDPDQYLAMKSAGAPAPASTGFDPDAYLSQKTQQDAPDAQPGLLSRLGNGFQKAMSTVDSYSGAPVRAAVGSLEKGGGVSDAVSAYGKQFGADPSTAPTSADIVEPLGISKATLKSSGYADTVERGLLHALHIPMSPQSIPSVTKGLIENTSPNDVAATAAGAVTDPLTYVPIGKLGEAGARGAVSLAEKAGEVLPKAGNALAKGISDATVRIGSATTGVEPGAIQTYIDRIGQVTDLAKKYGNNMATAADDVRQGFMDKIRAFRQEQSGNISKALANSDYARNISVSDAIDSLENSRAKLNPSYDRQQIQEIDKLINAAKDANTGGKTTAEGAYRFKQFLQERAANSYLDNGQIFMPGKKSQQAAKQAARIVRGTLEDAADKGWFDPTILDADSKLHQLHKIEDRLTNKNLVAPGAPPNAVIEAGRVPGSRNANTLQQLEDLTGKSFSQDAKDLGAVSRFGKADVFPVDATGKSTARILGTGALTAAASIVGAPAAATAALSTVATSPLALKTAIQTGKISADVVRKAAGVAGPLTMGMLNKASQVLSTPEGKGLLQSTIGAGVPAMSQQQGLMR